MIEGWVCIGRKMTEWEWYSDSNVVRLFLHILLMANFKDNQWQGRTINRGQWVSSRATVSHQTGLTIKQIRNAEGKLVLSGSLVVDGANRFTRYTIVKYDEYQKPHNERAIKGQTEGNQRAIKGQQLNKDNKETKEEPLTPFPDWIPKQDWDDWIAQRKKKPTQRAIELSIQTLAKLKDEGHPPEKVLQQSIQRGWEGLFAIKPDFQSKGTPHGTQRKSTIDIISEQLAAARAEREQYSAGQAG